MITVINDNSIHVGYILFFLSSETYSKLDTFAISNIGTNWYQNKTLTDIDETRQTCILPLTLVSSNVIHVYNITNSPRTLKYLNVKINIYSTAKASTVKIARV